MGNNFKDLSYEEANEMVLQRADELAKSLNTKVMPMLFNHNEEWIVGYIKKPNRTTVRMAVDKLEKYGKLDAGDLILQTSLLKEESDYRIMDMNSEFDGINGGACLEALNLIEINISVVKKNTNNTD